ncbi:MAG: hypothetical protein QGF67_17365 [Lentisphaeria bacterium]|jgi:hypothetical protein|nr:hypothetical protein [Lentisphaeria bacterium]
MVMEKIDPEEHQKRLGRITEIFSDIVEQSGVQATHRCLYRDRLDRCTAKFGCRNQRKPLANGGPRQCGGDDKIDYRSAWETDAPEEAE